MKIEAIILAAGKGTRMKSDSMPKVMHNVAGMPMIGRIVDVVESVCLNKNIVVGHMRQQVIDYLSSNYKNVVFSVQENQNGTGGAVISAIENVAKNTTHVIVTAGDTPLLKKETFEKLVAISVENGSDLTVVTTNLPDAGHYGRIKRDESGNVLKIVEFVDASAEELEIKEINSGIYFVEVTLLKQLLGKLDNKNKKGEYYLTDIVELASNLSKKVTTYVEADIDSVAGVNSIEELKKAEEDFLKRV